MKHKFITPWLIVLGLLAALGGWAWTQTVESLSLPSSAIVGQTVTAAMTNLNVSQDYILDWSDGTTDPFNTGRGTTQNLSHSYASAGTFMVILKRVIAPGNEQPVAQASIKISFPPCNIVVTPSNTTFGTSTSAQISNLAANLAWNLDWGDGSTDAFNSSSAGGFTGSHTFATTGTFQLKVTTPPLSAGIPGTPICLATAQVSLPVPTLTVAPLSVTLGQATTATVGNLLAAISYTLIWGDGSSDPISGVTTASISHTYANASTYAVKLTATGIAPVIQSITVKPPLPTLDLSPNPATVGDLVSANITNLNAAVNYSLNWGDGSSETIGGTANITSQHAYAAPGTYSVQLSAPGSVPVISSITITIPTPTMTVTPSSVTVGQAVTANIGNLVSIVAYNIDWGDGSSDPVGGAVTAAPTHVYASNGTFTLKLTTTGIAPVISSVTVTIPTPSFALAPSSLILGQATTATVKNLVSSVDYLLDWGDGASDPISGVTTFSAAHIFAAPGTFALKLSAKGIAPIIQTVTVSVPTPTLLLESNSLNLGQVAKASLGNLIPSVTYTLDWGDNSSDTSTGKTADVLTHTYAATGVFALKLSTTGIAPVIGTITVSNSAAFMTLSPNPINLGQTLSAKLTGLAASVNYTLDWGDNSSDPITGVSSASLKHTYATTGVYVVNLGSVGGIPVIDTVHVEIPVPTLNFSQTDLNPGQALTITFGNLLPVVNYSLDWGDDSAVETISGGSSATAKHEYAAAGNYVVKLNYPNNAPAIQAITVSVPVPGLDFNPNTVLPNQVVTANLTQLLAAVDYSLDWGDGEVSTVGGKTSASLKHSYAALGNYILKLHYLGGVDIIKPLMVSLAGLNESMSFTGFASANSAITFNLTGLLKSPDYSYTLEFGAGNDSEPVTVKADGTASLKYTYGTAGVKVVKLKLNGVGANNLLRGTLTLNLGSALQISRLELAFQPQASTNINLKQLSTQSAALSVAYSGSGLFEGNWFLDGQLLDSASLNLSANKTLWALNLDVPTNVEGVHKLLFKTIPDPSNPVAIPVVSNTITYTVTPAKLPTTLEIAGFTLEVQTITDPVLTELAGTASLDLIVGGALAAENMMFTFSALNVTMNGTTAKVISGQLEKKFSPYLVLNAPLGLASQQLAITKLLLNSASGAKLDGWISVQHPGCVKLNNVSGFGADALEKASKTQPIGTTTYTPKDASNTDLTNIVSSTIVPANRFEFSNQALSASGDLYATGTSKTGNIKLGCSGVTLTPNQTVTLDLSSSQSPSTLEKAYSSNFTPPDLSNTWMGLFFPNAKLELAGLIGGVAFAPVAFNAGGYNFHLRLIGASKFADPNVTPNGSLPAPTINYQAWNFTVGNLELGVNQTEVTIGKAFGTTKIEFLNETLKVIFNWQPDASWAISTQGVYHHDFGKTRIDTGIGGFVEQSQNLMLKFPCAAWAIGAIATSDNNLSGETTDDTSWCENGEIDSNSGSLFSGARQGTTGQPVYSPVTPTNAKQDLQSSVKVDLAGLGINAGGLTSLNNSYAWQPLQNGGDVKLLGFAFPVTKIAVLRQVDRFYLALQGELEMGRLNDNTPLPTRKSVVKYFVKNGKDETLVMDKSAYQADVNATTKFNLAANTQTWQTASLGTNINALLSSKNPSSKTPKNTLLESKRNSSLNSSMLAASGSDFEFADGGTIDIEGMSATVNAAFGLKGGVDYFFVWANVESNTPLFSLGVMSFFEFHGGVAHHMKWATGKYRQAPSFDKNTALQIQVGAVLGTPTDGSTIHLDGTVLVDISGSVEIYADGWLFTTVANGYRAKAKPVARAYIGINKDRLLLQACVGNSSPPNKSGITCSDLKDLSFFGVATANGWLELYVPFKNTHMHLYVGSYSNPVNATFFQIYKATGYVMLGYIEGDQKPPAAQVGFGFWAGGSVGYDFDKHDEGSAICNWEWHFGFHYKIAADFGVQVTPKFFIDASVSFSAGFKAGAHVCGIGANFEIDVDLYGHIHAPNPTQFDGTAKLYIDLPIIPTFTVKVSVNITF